MFDPHSSRLFNTYNIILNMLFLQASFYKTKKNKCDRRLSEKFLLEKSSYT